MKEEKSLKKEFDINNPDFTGYIESIIFIEKNSSYMVIEPLKTLYNLSIGRNTSKC